jgi:hypothetical protein
MHANRKHPSAARALGALACLALALGPRVAGAQCSYTALTDQVPVTVTNSPAFYTVNQVEAYWTAVAVKPPSGTDWDISLWQGTDIYPTCVSTQLAGSALGYGVDFVVGDYNHNPTGVRYVEVNRYSGTGDGTLEWSATDGQLPINGPLVTAAFGAPVHVYDVYLEAGRSYEFLLQRTAVADIHMLLFRNETGGTCWKGRSAAEWDATVGTITYTAPSTGFYGLAVVKDDQAMGDARVRVAACMPPVALFSGAFVGSNLAQNLFSFDQQQHYWTAVGLRGSQYWGMSVYRSDPGTPIGACFADELASNNSTPTSVGVLVGDFDYNASGTYYVDAHYPYDYPTGPGYVQWEDGADALFVNGMITRGTMTGNDIVRAWDLHLEGGTSYHFTFGRSGADLKLLLFRNAGSGEYWAGRGSQVLTATADADYTAPATGYYGVVVVNDDGGTGDYVIGVGTCSTPAALDNGVPYPTFLGENYVQFDQTQAYWTAIGVRGSDPATDWDMAVQGNTGEAFPACRGPELGVSNQYPPTVDFVVGDFNYNTTGTYHAWPHTYNGGGSEAGTVLWDRTEGMLVTNGGSVVHATGPGQFLQIWDAYLAAGQSYTFTLFPMGTGVKLLLFRNPAAGTYWAPRSSAEFEVGTTERYVTRDYTAPTSGWYGVAVVNDEGVTGAFAWRFGSCGTPTALASGTVVTNALLENVYSFAQVAPYWTAIGVRSAGAWEITGGGTTFGLIYPSCVDWVAGSNSGGLPPVGTRAPVVVGDFNHNAPGTYYSRLGASADPPGTATVEWDSGMDLITVGAPATVRSTGPDDVLEAWDCWLAPQKFYTFEFSHTGAADPELLVFGNRRQGAYWAPRESALVAVSANVTWRTPAATGQYYGLVVVNDNGGEGTYSLQVTDPGTADVEESPPVPTALAGLRPNPARGGMSIAFGLREAATVAFDVLDLSGRRVATLPARDFDAGERTATWDGRGDAGARLPAGLYFVRMTAGGRVVGTTRVALLD